MNDEFFESILLQSNRMLNSSHINTNTNVFISVPNIFFILSMLQMGADKNTLIQLRKFLGTNNLPALNENNGGEKQCHLTSHNVNERFLKFVNYLTETSKSHGTIKASSRIYTPIGSNGYNINKNFNLCCQQIFNSSAESIDFSQIKKSVNTINDWVSESTNGKIKNLVSEDDLSDVETKMILISSLYFKQNWMYPFDPEYTIEDIFHLSSTKTSKIKFMQKKIRLNYLKFNKFKMVALPYQYDKEPDLFAIFVISNDDNQSEKLYEMNAEDYFNNLFNRKIHTDNLTSRVIQVDLKIPKFKLTSKIKLNDYLSTDYNAGGGGISDLFNQNLCNLSKLTNDQEDLYVSNVIHSTFLEIDEVGTEAAASTAVQINTRMAGPRFGPEKFYVDRPFLFYIYSKELGLPLFSGYISDPQQ